MHGTPEGMSCHRLLWLCKALVRFSGACIDARTVWLSAQCIVPLHVLDTAGSYALAPGVAKLHTFITFNMGL